MDEQLQPIKDKDSNDHHPSSGKAPPVWSCSSEELSSKVDAVRQAVIRLEEAHATGELGNSIARAGLDFNLGPNLLEHYTHLFETSVSRSCDFRKYWVNYALDAFSYSLRPAIRIYEAYFEESSNAPEAQSVAGKIPWKLIIPHDEGLKFVYPHQIESCRHWGVWFNPRDPESDSRLTHLLLSAALNRLVSDLCGIAHMERALQKGGTKLDQARMEVSGSGPEFTRLIHDVLNENECIAHFARLIEDLMERTDLRLRYAGLGRKHGARCQISFASREEHHRIKLGKMHLGEEYVFISPYGIAETIIHNSNMPFMKEVDWHAFWSLCGVHTDEVEVLGGILKTHFNRARYRANDHPMGAVGILHPEIKRVIRAITLHAAFTTTNHLRWREQSRGRFRPSSRHRGKS